MNSTLMTTPEKTTHTAAAISVISSQTSSGSIRSLAFPTRLPVPNSFNKGDGVSVPISLLMPTDAFQVGGRRRTLVHSGVTIPCLVGNGNRILQK